MSRTDHARRRNAYGHRTGIRTVRLFTGEVGHQAFCSCGLAGEIHARHADAERDGYEHRRPYQMPLRTASAS